MATSACHIRCKELKTSKEILEAGVWGPRPLPWMSQCQLCIAQVLCDGPVPRSAILKNKPEKSDSQYTCCPGGVLVNHVMGEAESNVDCALEHVICSMLPGEKCSVTVKGSECALSCVIHVYQISNPPAMPDWSPDYAVEAATRFKRKGVELFGNGYLEDAFHLFSLAFNVLLLCEVSTEPKLKSNLASNIAACHLSKGNTENVLHLCQIALDYEPNNVKALYRQAKAAFLRANWELAETSIRSVLGIESKNPEALGLLAIIKEHTQHSEAEYRQIVQRMFSDT